MTKPLALELGKENIRFNSILLGWTETQRVIDLMAFRAKNNNITIEELRCDSCIFQVEFNNPGGSLFVLGPCSGANKTEMPPISQFEYTVSRNADRRFVVMNTPPYVP